MPEDLSGKLKRLSIAGAMSERTRLAFRIESIRLIIDNSRIARLTSTEVELSELVLGNLYDAQFTGRYGDEWLDTRWCDALVAKAVHRCEGDS